MENSCHTVYTDIEVVGEGISSSGIKQKTKVGYTVYMSEVLQANIFFIITSIAVLVFTLFVCVILYNVIRILKSIRKIVDRVQEGSDVIAEDVSQLRAYVVEGSLVSQIMSFFMGKSPKATRRKSKDITND